MAAESTRVEVTRTRRRFSIEDKRRIVADYRAASNSTERGGVLRREQIYQSHVSKWGRQIDDGTLGTKRPGPPATGKDPAKVRVRALEAQLAAAKQKISTLEELVTAQGKCLALHVDVRLDDSATSQTW